MPVILSLTENHEEIWALGPEGLFLYKNGALLATPQPDHHPSCCFHNGERLLVGGATHGVAYTTDDGGWRASWVDNVTAPVVCLAPHPDHERTGVILAGTSGAGVLRSANRGRDFFVCNFGLFDFDVLTLAWAPPPPDGDWPPLEVVFAGAGNGLYRSPNAGRGWKQIASLPAPVLSIAVSPAFHGGGPVLAGTEGAGLWRSDDGGYTFRPVPDSPEVVNALLALPDGWLLSDVERIWRSEDGIRWTPLPSPPALTFLRTRQGRVLAGGMEGVFEIQ